MNMRRTLISTLLILALLLFTLALGSCEAIGNLFGAGDQTGSDQTGGDQTGGDQTGGDQTGGDQTGGNEGDEAPDAVDLAAKFYDAANWSYMTNNNGASTDVGDVVYALDDGSIKFHRENQAIEYGDLSNATVSFMLKGTNDWKIWFNSSSKDNHNNYSYRLVYEYSGLRIVLSSAPDQAAANIDGTHYKKGEWNRFDIVFATKDGVCNIEVYINGHRASLTAGDNTSPQIKVENNTFTHTQPAMFKTGNYIVVKAWDAKDFLQLKPVAKAGEKDVPVIAAIGDSITEGAGAGNHYTESTSAQLQKALGGAYNVINFGLSGTTAAMKPNGEAWLDNSQWKGVQAIAPDIAIIALGTNDSKYNPSYDAFYADYKNIIDKLLEVNPDMKIIMSTSPTAYSAGWGISNASLEANIVPAQKALATEYSLDVIDMHEITKNKSDLFPDGIHPSTRGYSMFAKVYAKAIKDGVEALDTDFLAAINAEYEASSPNYKTVTDVKAVISNKTLTVTGKTTDTALKLYIGQDESKTDVYNSYTDVTVASDGSFSVSFDLGTMPIGGWYNVKLYMSDNSAVIVSLNSLKDGEGNSISLWSYIPIETTQVQICSWDASGVPTLSFSVEAYTPPAFETSVTGGSIVVDGDKIILTVTGTTNDAGAVLLVGVSDDPEVYGHEMTIENGSFTATLDLAPLEVGKGWYNVRIVMSDGNMVAVPYDKLGVSVEQKFYAGEKSVTIKNWSSGDKLTSLFVEDITLYLIKSGKPNKDSYPFFWTQEGDKVYLNFNGELNESFLNIDPTAERDIKLLFTLSDPAETPSSVDNVVYTAENLYDGESNTAFNFKINVTDSIGIQNGWIRFVLQITEGDTTSYYTIKPIDPTGDGQWYALGSPITLNGTKYELAICYNSIFIQVING